jgi:hypothetical protein
MESATESGEKKLEQTSTKQKNSKRLIYNTETISMHGTYAQVLGHQNELK